MNESKALTSGQISVFADYARGLLVIGVFCAAGILVRVVFETAIPAPLIGMVLLAGALKLGLPARWIETAGGFLLKHMSLFFLPILLGAGHELAQNAEARVPVIIAVVGGTLLTLVVTQQVCERWVAKPIRKEDV